MAASTQIRAHFTWDRTADAVERRLLAQAGQTGQPRLGQPAPHGRRAVPQSLVGDCQDTSRGDAETRRTYPRPPDSSEPDSPSLAVGPMNNEHPGAMPTALPLSSASPRLRARPCIVSLTMIVRNEQENLPNALSSVAGLFDEIVVVDTGSTDRTAEIARQFGARVFDFVWVDDFAAARNAALARAMGDYAFWLDADDVIDPPQRAKLEALLDGLRGPARCREGEPPCEPGLNPARAEPRPPGSSGHCPGPAGYVLRCACDPGQDGSGGDTVVDHIRLLPLREDVRWTWPIRCSSGSSPRSCSPTAGTRQPGANLNRMANTPDPRDFYRVSGRC